MNFGSLQFLVKNNLMRFKYDDTFMIGNETFEILFHNNIGSLLMRFPMYILIETGLSIPEKQHECTCPKRISTENDLFQQFIKQFEMEHERGLLQ